MKANVLDVSNFVSLTNCVIHKRTNCPAVLISMNGIILCDKIDGEVFDDLIENGIIVDVGTISKSDGIYDVFVAADVTKEDVGKRIDKSKKKKEKEKEEKEKKEKVAVVKESVPVPEPIEPILPIIDEINKKKGNKEKEGE